jgi:hypothetical protein
VKPDSNRKAASVSPSQGRVYNPNKDQLNLQHLTRLDSGKIAKSFGANNGDGIEPHTVGSETELFAQLSLFPKIAVRSKIVRRITGNTGYDTSALNEQIKKKTPRDISRNQ